MKWKRLSSLFLICVFGLGAWFESTYETDNQIVATAENVFNRIETPVNNIAENSKRNILRLGLQVSAIGKLDPHFATGAQDRAIADMVFNGLLRYVPGNAPEIEADLAESIPTPEVQNSNQV